MLLDLNPGGNLENPFLKWWWHMGLITVAQITDAKFILSSSSNLDLLMTVDRMAVVGEAATGGPWE